MNKENVVHASQKDLLFGVHYYFLYFSSFFIPFLILLVVQLSSCVIHIFTPYNSIKQAK